MILFHSQAPHVQGHFEIWKQVFTVSKLLVHKHGDRKRCSHDSSWEDYFSGLVNLLDIYENYSLDINLDFPSAAILFNQLDITVSVLRSVSDSIADLSLPCTDQLQELCSCFSEIQLYRWNKLEERKKNHKYSRFGSTFCRYEWSGKAKV